MFLSVFTDISRSIELGNSEQFKGVSKIWLKDLFDSKQLQICVSRKSLGVKSTPSGTFLLLLGVLVRLSWDLLP